MEFIIWLGLFPARRQILERRSWVCVYVSCPTLFKETTGPIFVKTKGLSTDMV